MYQYSQATHDGLCGFYAVLNAFAHLSSEPGMNESLVTDAQQQSFFDDGVESLARLPGISARVLKGNDGGIDETQIEDLCRIIVRRRNLPISVKRARTARVFHHRYSELASHPQPFALIIPLEDRSHWVTVVRADKADHYTLIDNAEPKIKKLGAKAGYCSADAIILRHDIAALA